MVVAVQRFVAAVAAGTETALAASRSAVAGIVADPAVLAVSCFVVAGTEAVADTKEKENN